MRHRPQPPRRSTSPPARPRPGEPHGSLHVQAQQWADGRRDRGLEDRPLVATHMSNGPPVQGSLRHARPEQLGVHVRDPEVRARHDEQRHQLRTRERAQRTRADHHGGGEHGAVSGGQLGDPSLGPEAASVTAGGTISARPVAIRGSRPRRVAAHDGRRPRPLDTEERGAGSTPPRTPPAAARSGRPMARCGSPTNCTRRHQTVPWVCASCRARRRSVPADTGVHVGPPRDNSETGRAFGQGCVCREGLCILWCAVPQHAATTASARSSAIGCQT